MLRRANIDDMHTIWKWRNDPITRKMSVTTEKIKWCDHVKWFTSSMNNPNRSLYMFEVNGLPVATLRLDINKTNEAEISVNVSPKQRGKGYGKRAIISCINLGFSLFAQVKPENEPSVRMFSNLGFRETSRENGLIQFRYRKCSS